MPSITLRARILEKNLDRNYTISVQRGLFGLWAVTICYGKWDTAGRKLQYGFETPQLGQRFIQQTLRKRLNSYKRIGCTYQIVEQRGDTQDLEFWFALTKHW